MNAKEWSEHIAVAAFVVDDRGRICAANKAMRTLVGAPDIVGSALADLAPGDLELVGGASETLQKVDLVGLLALPRSVRTGEVCFARGRIHRPDGLVLEVVFRAIALTPGEGQRLDAVLVSSIDAAGWSERALRLPETDADRVYRVIFDHSPIGIFHFDKRGLITACNEVIIGLMGSTRQQLLGIDLGTLPNPELRACVARALAGTASVFSGEYVSVTGNKPSSLHADLAPIFDAEGALAGGVGFVQDVSERRAAERAAARADRMASLATLAAGTVHEMQDPLALTVTSLDLAARLLKGNEPSELAAAIAAARQGAAQITDLTQDLSSFARGDDALRVPVSVEDALDAAIAVARESFREKATLERIVEAVPLVPAIERKLVQLFKSLLQNAADAIPPGKKGENKITIGLRRVDDRVEIAFSDTGRGLDAESRRHLFEPFSTTKPGALGLGLAAAHGIAKSFGGELVLTSTCERGTTFTVSLPVAERVSEAAPSAPTTPRSSSRAHLLLIDDEERLAETLRMALAFSHDVTIATSGNEALAKIRAGTPAFDLVLCDLFLPDISGPDIYAEVQRTRPELLARFVFLTGGAFTESARRFLQNIDNPRLEKPFDLGTLEDLISERLATFGR